MPWACHEVCRKAGCRKSDGHDDLKPEHICFQNGVVIFDRLEFSTRLRQVDPVDEIGYLAMECARLGADWLGPPLLQAPSLEIVARATL
jgi:aminoglycoside phosphotransferase family enzyme